MNKIKKELLKHKFDNYNNAPLTLINATFISEKDDKSGQKVVKVTEFKEFNTPVYQCERFYKPISRCIEI